MNHAKSMMVVMGTEVVMINVECSSVRLFLHFIRLFGTSWRSPTNTRFRAPAIPGVCVQKCCPGHVPSLIDSHPPI